MKLYLVRHGETDWNAAGILMGQTNIPLNATGVKQAEVLRDKIVRRGLEFDAVTLRLSSALPKPLKLLRQAFLSLNKKQQGTFAILGATLAVAGVIAAGINFNNNSESNLQTSTPGYSLQTEAIESSSASKVQSSTVPATETKTESSTYEIPF